MPPFFYSYCKIDKSTNKSNIICTQNPTPMTIGLAIDPLTSLAPSFPRKNTVKNGLKLMTLKDIQVLLLIRTSS